MGGSCACDLLLLVLKDPHRRLSSQRRLGRAVARIHDAEVVHGDLTTSNFLVVEEEEEEQEQQQ